MISQARSDDLRSKVGPDDATDPRPGIGYVWVGAILAIVASLPALFARQVFGDDWTVYYIYWTQGAAGLARVLRESAHAGFALPMTLFIALLPDRPEVVARLAGLGCHLVNGVLIYAILSRSSHTRRIAALFTALFLLSPFYVIRLTQNAVYDFFLLFYLLSYELTYSKVRTLRWAAPLSLLFSLSLETLIALEPLRILLALSSGERWPRTLARLLPFWLAVVAMIVLRLTILGKSGHYTGQYSLVPDAGVIGHALWMHLTAFSRGLSYAYFTGFALLGDAVSTVLTVVVAAVFVLFSSGALRTPWLLKSGSAAGSAVLLLLLGAAIAVLGGLPYALTGVFGDVTRGESRLLFPSQFGILILMAAIIQAMPGLRVRAAVAGAVITVFTLSMAHDSKWLLYDGALTADIQRQVRAALLADPEPKVVKLQVEGSEFFTFRSRCLGGSDMNVAQTILRDENRAPSYVYTDYCGDFTNNDLVAGGGCTVSYLEFRPCPPRRETWRYRATPGFPQLNEVGMVELLTAALTGFPSATGGRGELMQLTNGGPKPLARAEYRPPCTRPGVRASAWVLGLPVPACDEPAPAIR